MLSKNYRLTLSSDFKNVTKLGKRVDSKSFLLFYLKDDRVSRESRFGFVISTKVSKSAVARNKIKRGLSEGVRQNIAYIKPSFDCVFLVKAVAVSVYSADLIRETKEVLEKVNII